VEQPAAEAAKKYAGGYENEGVMMAEDTSDRKETVWFVMTSESSRLASQAGLLGGGR
jgi:hypothetical protein